MQLGCLPADTPLGQLRAEGRQPPPHVRQLRLQSRTCDPSAAADGPSQPNPTQPRPTCWGISVMPFQRWAYQCSSAVQIDTLHITPAMLHRDKADQHLSAGSPVNQRCSVSCPSNRYLRYRSEARLIPVQIRKQGQCVFLYLSALTFSFAMACPLRSLALRSER
jgi:hypothetical protein|eukprot:COSAG01_NODE_668_length_14381_cov_74.372847_5_plen_164_part_00